MSDNNILAQIGLLDGGRGRDGTAATAGADGDVATIALRKLIESGKVSIDDAQAAVQSARHSKAAAAVGVVASSNKDNRKNNNVKITNSKKKNKKEKPKQQEICRTRHIALQFSYDGTEFSGFAENIGKEGDNSVEKALFAAMEKTRLLVSPEENGMLVMNRNKDGHEIKVLDEGNGGGGGNNNKSNEPMTARIASRYSRCGRTDKGVHAHGQVVALYLKSAFPLSAREAMPSESVIGDDDVVPGDVLQEEHLPNNSLDGLECFVPPKKSKDKSLQQKTVTECNYPKILNNLLPPSIRVLGWCPVSSGFNARFSCARRTYRYFFPRRALNLSAMAKGLGYMMGRHDFRNMCKMNCEQVYNFERVLISGKIVSSQKVYEVSMEENEQECSSVQEVEGDFAQPSPHDMCHVEIIGQAFLWHQIRCIMAVLFLVGRELEKPTIVRELFDIKTNPAKPAYAMASETALVLQDCEFAHLKLGRTVRNLWDLTKVLERRWEDHAVSAARANDALQSIKEETEVRWMDVVEFAEEIASQRRKKEQKRTRTEVNDDGEVRKELEKRAPDSPMISWYSATKIMHEVLGVCPYLPNGSSPGQKGQTDSSLHMPLMERAKGTTYEEKVESILGLGGGNKRKHRYEENIIKKRKTAKEDKDFYNHMLQQGGSCVDH